jgi:hypothetical protein
VASRINGFHFMYSGLLMIYVSRERDYHHSVQKCMHAYIQGTHILITYNQEMFRSVDGRLSPRQNMYAIENRLWCYWPKDRKMMYWEIWLEAILVEDRSIYVLIQNGGISVSYPEGICLIFLSIRVLVTFYGNKLWAVHTVREARKLLLYPV